MFVMEIYVNSHHTVLVSVSSSILPVRYPQHYSWGNYSIFQEISGIIRDRVTSPRQKPQKYLCKCYKNSTKTFNT